jgi:hypothetical protein
MKLFASSLIAILVLTACSNAQLAKGEYAYFVSENDTTCNVFELYVPLTADEVDHMNIDADARRKVKVELEKAFPVMRKVSTIDEVQFYIRSSGWIGTIVGDTVASLSLKTNSRDVFYQIAFINELKLVDDTDYNQMGGHFIFHRRVKRRLFVKADQIDIKDSNKY